LGCFDKPAKCATAKMARTHGPIFVTFVVTRQHLPAQ
jgi:hypothetical protein